MKTFFIYGWIVAGALAAFIFIPAHALAATNINSTTSQHFAWNDEIGWIDFYSTGNVNVSSSQLSGYASSSVGSVSLDCATSPSGNICVTSNYKVANNGGGSLSGWAWNDEIGWISFYWGNTSANPAVSSTSMCNTYSAPYSSWCGVTINSSGVFQGFAWNDVVGWISFNCNNTLSCGTSNYEVATSWAATSATGTLDSQTFDTGVASGAQLNSITWKGGAIPTGASVGFQIAVSNSSSGPWNFIGPGGTSGSTYVASVSGAPIPLGNYVSLAGRYFRYRVILSTNPAQTQSPSVTSVIVNWSP